MTKHTIDIKDCDEVILISVFATMLRELGCAGVRRWLEREKKLGKLVCVHKDEYFIPAKRSLEAFCRI